MPEIEQRSFGLFDLKSTGYDQQLVTIKELHRVYLSLPGIRGISLSSLYARSEKLLVYVDSAEGGRLFDLVPSIIRFIAARKSKGPGVAWGKIERIFDLDPFLTQQAIIDRLRAGENPTALIDDFQKRIQDTVKPRG